MVTLNEGTFRSKLYALNTTQQSIEGTSTWCGYFRKDARKLVAVWEEAFR